MQTIHVETELDAPASRVWAAMQHPATFLYVCRGLIGIPQLAGRSEPFREGESGTGWLFLFHLVPLSRHAILLESLDDAGMTMRSREHGGMLRAWHHTLHAEALPAGRTRYSDTVEIDAGLLTPVVARVSVGIYRYRQRRWRRLARRHLQS